MVQTDESLEQTIQRAHAELARLETTLLRVISQRLTFVLVSGGILLVCLAAVVYAIAAAAGWITPSTSWTSKEVLVVEAFLTIIALAFTVPTIVQLSGLERMLRIHHDRISQALREAEKAA